MERPGARRFQLTLLIPALLFAFASSYYSWTHNTHEKQLRRVYPGWFTGPYVIFDGYGQYAGQIQYLIQHPSQTPGFEKFVKGYIHSNTPFFPFLAAAIS